MPTYLVFARHEYAEPLEHLGEVTTENVPTLDDVADLRDEEAGEWLELVVIPAGEVRWIQRDGDLVAPSLMDGAVEAAAEVRA